MIIMMIDDDDDNDENYIYDGDYNGNDHDRQR